MDQLVPKHYSLAFKEKMVNKLIGKNAVSANRLSKEVGVCQDSLSRWLREAHTLPPVAKDKRPARRLTLEKKIEILAAAAKLDGEQLAAYLAREQVTLADLQRWRVALEDDNAPVGAAGKRIRKLELELARKDKALAEAAALLILKKKLEALYSEDEDESTDEENEK